MMIRCQKSNEKVDGKWTRTEQHLFASARMCAFHLHNHIHAILCRRIRVYRNGVANGNDFHCLCATGRSYAVNVLK